jgi:hypothetical protein
MPIRTALTRMWARASHIGIPTNRHTCKQPLIGACKVIICNECFQSSFIGNQLAKIGLVQDDRRSTHTWNICPRPWHMWWSPNTVISLSISVCNMPPIPSSDCPNVPLSGGHRVIDVTNGNFIHAGPLLKRDRSFYLSIEFNLLQL